jgi:hypothetical protein
MTLSIGQQAQTLAFAAALTTFSTIASGQFKDVDGWQSAKWGMSQSAITKAYNGEVKTWQSADGSVKPLMNPKLCGKTAGAAKAVDGYENPLGRKAREGSSPSARTNSPSKPKRVRITMIRFRQSGPPRPSPASS